MPDLIPEFRSKIGIMGPFKGARIRIDIDPELLDILQWIEDIAVQFFSVYKDAGVRAFRLRTKTRGRAPFSREKSSPARKISGM